MSHKRNSILFFLLLPFSVLYGIVVLFRNTLFDWGWIPSRKFNKAIISIGNLTTGGTGKTPHAEYLIALLKEEFSVAFLSRGYKRKTKGFILADEHSSAEEIGDEPAQVKAKHPEIVVAVSEKRVRGIEKILEGYPDTDVVILDDAFQHRYVEPGLSVLLFDFRQNTFSDFLLPSGNLREPFASRRRANVLLVTKTPADIKPIEKRLYIKDYRPGPYQSVYFSYLKYGQPAFVFEPSRQAPTLQELREQGYTLLVVTGIAFPEPLLEHLMNSGIRFSHMPFADHHAFREDDLVKLLDRFDKLEASRKLILTTEKDAIRFKKFGNIAGDLQIIMAYLPVEVIFSEEEARLFNQQIRNYVRTSKRDSLFHSGENQVKS
jgi:tetraacyldisaccharide 4'-kinase